MAQFDANINLDVNVNRALAGVNKVEKAVNRLNQGATVDVKVGNLNEAERAAARLYKQLERLENAALSKLPASLQTVIAYLKAASAGMGELASRAITVAAAMGDIGRVNFAPLVRQLNQVSDLMFEIERVTVKFFNNPRNFRPRIEGGNPFQKLLDGLDYVKVSVDQPFQKILDGLDLVDVRVIQTERLLKGLGDTVKRIGGAGFGGPGGLGPGGPPGPGGPGGPLARRGGSAEPFDLNTLRGLRQLQAALRNLLETTQIGSKRFRDLENSIAELNNEIRDAQLLGQRGGSGINVAGNAARRRRRKRAGGEALTGFAFPLLFGGGPGAALGGALGGGIGGLVSGSFGIGLSLLLSEIGSLFDQLAGKSLKLAKSLLDVENSFTTLSAESLTLSRAREKELKALSESGFSIEASIKAQEDLAEILGNQTVNNLRSAGEAFDQLGREFAETIARLGAALDQSGILKFVNDRFAEFNQKAALSSDVFAAQKVAREQGTAADRRLGNSIVNQFLQEGTAAEEEIRTRLAKLADSLPAINVKLNIPTSEQLKIEEQIEGIQVQLNLVGNQQALFGFIEKFSKQADDTARKRERAASLSII